MTQNPIHGSNRTLSVHAAGSWRRKTTRNEQMDQLSYRAGSTRLKNLVLEPFSFASAIIFCLEDLFLFYLRPLSQFSISVATRLWIYCQWKFPSFFNFLTFLWRNKSHEIPFEKRDLLTRCTNLTHKTEFIQAIKQNFETMHTFLWILINQGKDRGVVISICKPRFQIFNDFMEFDPWVFRSIRSYPRAGSHDSMMDTLLEQHQR